MSEIDGVVGQKMTPAQVVERIGFGHAMTDAEVDAALAEQRARFSDDPLIMQLRPTMDARVLPGLQRQLDAMKQSIIDSVTSNTRSQVTQIMLSTRKALANSRARLALLFRETRTRMSVDEAIISLVWCDGGNESEGADQTVLAAARETWQEHIASRWYAMTRDDCRLLNVPKGELYKLQEEHGKPRMLQSAKMCKDIDELRGAAFAIEYIRNLAEELLKLQLEYYANFSGVTAVAPPWLELQRTSFMLEAAVFQHYVSMPNYKVGTRPTAVPSVGPGAASVPFATLPLRVNSDS